MASSAFPRLSHNQWGNSVRDLLFLDSVPDLSGLTNDPPTGTGFDNNGGKLAVSASLWGDYQTASEDLAAALVADASRLDKVAPAGLPAEPTARARAFVEAFGRRAYRRPLSSAEVDAHVALFQSAAELYPSIDAFTAGVQLTITAMLQSPHFLYRVESGAADGGGAITLDDHQIAARMSYMLWDSIPDQALSDAADSGMLGDATVREAHARRMLGDAKAAQKLGELHRQLLELTRYDTMHAEGLPDTIGSSMRTETERFVEDVVVDNDGSLEDLLTAKHTFVNADLAALYGLTGSYGSDFVRAELDPATRSGLLTQSGFLTYRSGDTAPILRGVFINLKLLCADLPPPPVFTPPTMTGVTRRQRIESITGKGTCGESCHGAMINPAGFPLEHFDDVGRYRMLDNGQPIDATAEYRFADGVASYDGAVAWGKAVAASTQTHACYVKHWLEFGYGREAADGDEPLIARVAAASKSQALPVKEILVQLIGSPTFTTRGKEQP